ncbi:MAG: hypothetical protein U1F36_11035 [Planctomycetota bacterium]
MSYAETFYTDWMPRGGDCAILRAQALIKGADGGATVRISLETRTEQDAATTSMDTFHPSSSPKLLELTALGVKTAVYVATTGSNSPARGFQELVRCKISVFGGSAGDYWVVRIFPIQFFDNSVPSS